MVSRYVADVAGVPGMGEEMGKLPGYRSSSGLGFLHLFKRGLLAHGMVGRYGRRNTQSHRRKLN